MNFEELKNVGETLVGVANRRGPCVKPSPSSSRKRRRRREKREKTLPTCRSGPTGPRVAAPSRLAPQLCRLVQVDWLRLASAGILFLELIAALLMRSGRPSGLRFFCCTATLLGRLVLREALEPPCAREFPPERLRWEVHRQVLTWKSINISVQEQKMQIFDPLRNICLDWRKLAQEKADWHKIQTCRSKATRFVGSQSRKLERNPG
jgi:hypothetical protein